MAHAIVFGGQVRELQIVPDVRQLASLNLTLTDLIDGVRASLAVRGAGFVDLAAQRVLLKTPLPQPDLDRLGDTVVTVRSNTPVRLRDVATVQQGPALRSGDALIMGRPGVLISLASQYGRQHSDDDAGVEQALAGLEPALQAQGITVYGNLHRPANFIERALKDLEQSLIIAAILIVIVLYLFLRDVRAALIAFVAIPLSLLAATLVLERMGQTLNTMTLGGFAVALGVLVDDAIIGIENILRRLRQNRESAQPRDRLTLLLEGISRGARTRLSTRPRSSSRCSSQNC